MSLLAPYRSFTSASKLLRSNSASLALTSFQLGDFFSTITLHQSCRGDAHHIECERYFHNGSICYGKRTLQAFTALDLEATIRTLEIVDAMRVPRTVFPA